MKKTGSAFSIQSAYSFVLVVAVCLSAGCTSLSTRTVKASGLEPGKAGQPVISALPEQVAILPFVNETSADNAPLDLRREFYSHFALKNYRDIELSDVDMVLDGHGILENRQYLKMPPAELGKILAVEGIITGTVTGYNQLYLGLYSQVSVELDLRFVSTKTGETIWSGREKITHREGGLPFSIFDIFHTVFRTALNVRSDEFLRAADDLSRKIVAALPEPAYTAQYASGKARVVEAPLNSAEFFHDGIRQVQNEEYAEAVPVLRQAVAMEPENAGYHYNLGLLYFENGDLQKAVKSWENVVALDPTNQSARTLLEMYAGD